MKIGKRDIGKEKNMKIIVSREYSLLIGLCLLFGL